MRPHVDADEMALMIACTGLEDERLDVFYKDTGPDEELDTVAGWKLADGNISTYAPPRNTEADYSDFPGHPDEIPDSTEQEEPAFATFRWTDAGMGLSDRGKISEVRIRYYLIGRADMDADEDGIPDARELFIYGTDPLARDTDGDGMPDGWEMTNGLDPLRDDSKDDLDGDGRDNITEYLAGTRPQYSREHAVTIYVDSRNGQDGFSGLVERATDHDGPKRTITAALGAAIPGDTVIVGEGAYMEDVDLRGRSLRVIARGAVYIP